MDLLLHPCYFPNIITFATLLQYEVCWEVQDNYQKQTYRNRCYICTDQGRFRLNIPIKHVGHDQGKQKYAAVSVDNDYPWQRQHWRTLQTAYRTSPFFEFYEDDLAPLFEKEVASLLEFNLQTIRTVAACLQIPMPEKRSEVYRSVASGQHDGRYLVSSKMPLPAAHPEYVQVFGNKNPFIPHLSILDLLFNEGPQAVPFLRAIPLHF